MDVGTGVNVECADGPCGQSQYVILNPSSETITHVVVGEPDRFANTRLVPLTYVTESSPKLIRLKCTQAELQSLPLFSEYEPFKPEDPYLVYSPTGFWMIPLAAYWPVMRPAEHQYVPSGELPIRRGAHVEAIDGYVGTVREFLAEPSSGHITYLVLHESRLLGRRELVVPASAIDRIEQDTVHLRITKERVGLLPQLRPKGKEPGMTENPTARPEDPKASSGANRPVEALVAELGSDDRAKREKARLALVAIGAPAVDALARALAHEKTHVRWEAAKALQQMNDPAGAKAMVAALQDPDPGVRWVAADGLSLLGKPALVPLLTALASRSDSPWLRTGAHHVLSSLTDPVLRRDILPVFAALKGAEPALEIPVAAHNALVALRTAS